MPQAIQEPRNPEIHRRTTAKKSGTTPAATSNLRRRRRTGGTITGVGQVLKPRKPSLKIVVREARGSPVLSGGQHSPHKISGMRRRFIPPIFWSRSVIDEIVKVTAQPRIEMSRALAAP